VLILPGSFTNDDDNYAGDLCLPACLPACLHSLLLADTILI
jgi:hypothetical protein